MKKVLITIVIVILAYLVIVGVLTVTGVCPKYINFMGRVVGPGTENIKGPNDPSVWSSLFCPFAEKVY